MSLHYKSPASWLSLASRQNVIKLTPALFTGLMAVSGSRQNVIKLTPALTNPTILVGRQTERDREGRGGREAFHRLIDRRLQNNIGISRA